MKNGTECSQVLLKLVEMFSRFGLPDILVSDGGPPFNSYGFKNFLEKQGIIVLKSPPYHPPSNGQAERSVKTVKEVLKKFLLEPELAELRLEDQINLFLFNYRNTVSIDGTFPSEKMLAYKPKTLVDMLNPKWVPKKFLSAPQTNDEQTKTSNVIQLTRLDKLDHLAEGDEVWYKNHNPNNHSRWLKAIYLRRFSINTFQIMIGSARIIAHRDQLKMPKTLTIPTHPNVFIPPREIMEVPRGEQREDSGELPVETNRNGRRRKRDAQAAGLPDAPLRRSKRARAPNRIKDFVYN